MCNAIKCNKLCFFTSLKNATTEHDGTYLKIHNTFPKT